MVLDLENIVEIIKSRPNGGLIDKGVSYNRLLRKHLYGDGLSVDTAQIEGLEKKDIHILRKKYTKSNKDLFARLGRPIDKVFTAKGGGVYLGLNEDQERKAKLLASEIHGLSVREWVEKFWKPHMLDDPFGLIFMEIMQPRDVVIAKQKGKSFVYPTYQPIRNIYDYQPKGRFLEYVVFELSDQEKRKYRLEADIRAFRVVDDAFDYLVQWTGEDVRIIESQTLPNYFQKVPAMINSDLINPNEDNCYLSFYDEVIELAENFWLKGSIKVTHDFLHGFPKYSEFADDCNTCSGTGYVDSEHCPDCKGTKKKLMFKVSDSKALLWPTKDDAVILPNQVGGYISPDKTYHEIATADIKALEDVMMLTLWGAYSAIQDKAAAKTATQIIDEGRPIADRLSEISKMAEKRHKFILDCLIRVQVAPNYPGSSVNYGKRYLFESPEAIWKKYSQAKEAGSPQAVLDDLLNEYYQTEYQSDPIGLNIAQKLMYVEPFIHYSISQLKALDPEPSDYHKKLYYSEWLAMVPEGKILALSIEELKEDLTQFVTTKQPNF